ncbi:MAG: KH domain-containing protein [Deltaproteobacteria bacterium]|nr:KH domain-containing protein [Deltaproteobacteria bacterium]
MEVIAVKELIEIMAKALVEHPDQVQVNEIAGEHASVIELRTAKDDIGKVIGKRGRNAQAMRTILNAASAKLRKRVVLEIID